MRNETPRADGTYKYHYYKASALWEHYDSDTPKKDPLTNQPIWYEDWMALHDAYDPFPNAVDFIPSWVFDLPTREPGTVKAQRPPPLNPQPPVYAPQSRVPANAIRVRRMDWRMDSMGENEPAMESPTPIWVHRQPNRPQYQLTDEDRESERLRAVRIEARERFDRLLRLDEPSSLNALRNAMRDVELAGEALQEFLDRMANDEDTSRSRLRTLRAENERWMRQDTSGACSARWIGRGSGGRERSADAASPMRCVLCAKTPCPSERRTAQEQARIYQETQRQLNEQEEAERWEHDLVRARYDPRESSSRSKHGRSLK